MTQTHQSNLSPAAALILMPDGSVPSRFSADDLALLAAEIDRELAAAGHADAPALTQNVRVVAIAGVARRLLTQPGRAGLALSLLDCAPKPTFDRPPICYERLDAIAQVAGQEPALAELARLLALDDAGTGFRFPLLNRVVSMVQSGRLHLDEALHRLLWGNPANSLSQQIDDFNAVAERLALPPVWVAAILSIRQASGDQVAPLLHGMKWSALVCHYQASLALVPRMMRTKTDAGLPLTEIETRILALAGQTTGLEVAPDFSALLRTKAAGQSIVLLQAHAGMRSFVSRSMQAVGLPVSLVGAGRRVTGGPEDFHIVTSDKASLPFAFAKLAKLMRKSPRIVRIFPDGRIGGDLRKIEVLGRTVEIGMGGATLAYYGNSALFFASTRWTGAGFTVDFMPGPIIVPGTSREACDQLFADFYAKGIEKILLGPPVDMGLVGGFWPQVLRG